jgi:class 3 adenylate cyclase
MSVTAGERRVVSALVADVAGSTAIGEQLGPERSKFLFDEVVRLMREEVERFGGTVAQLTGDGVLALFGAPTAHEDDSERAVRSALALHESLARDAADVAPA